VKRVPKGWPTVQGRPATRAEIAAYVARVEAHFMGPIEPTRPHFCGECTAPLEVEPCPVCWGCRYKAQLQDLRAFLRLTDEK
jgi:hypothetical protein